jgi:hypothetical protein
MAPTVRASRGPLAGAASATAVSAPAASAAARSRWSTVERRRPPRVDASGSAQERQRGLCCRGEDCLAGQVAAHRVRIGAIVVIVAGEPRGMVAVSV